MSETSLSPEDFCVISAVNNEQVLAACLASSPDIANGTLPLTTVRNASSMANAYNEGLARTSRPICLLAHQDVYLPEGFLGRAIERLQALEKSHPDWMVAGPYGVRKDGRHVGRVWDVNMGRELGGSGFPPTAIESLDELLLVLKRQPGFEFDRQLPHFHFYGTDLVQTAWAMGKSAWAVELPVVHNNQPWSSLGGGYVEGYRYARRKWRHRLPLFTTICELSYNPIPLWRARWRRRHAPKRSDVLLADSAAVAAQAGYE